VQFGLNFPQSGVPPIEFRSDLLCATWVFAHLTARVYFRDLASQFFNSSTVAVSHFFRPFLRLRIEFTFIRSWKPWLTAHPSAINLIYMRSLPAFEEEATLEEYFGTELLG
jgi:hypothetical protein